MADQKKDFPNSATLFRNEKRANPKAPNAKGSGVLTIPGDYLVEHWDGTGDLEILLILSAWTRETKGGGKFQSLSFQIKGEWQKRPAEMSAPAPKRDRAEPDDDGSIPF